MSCVPHLIMHAHLLTPTRNANGMERARGRGKVSLLKRVKDAAWWKQQLMPAGGAPPHPTIGNKENIIRSLLTNMPFLCVLVTTSFQSIWKYCMSEGECLFWRKMENSGVCIDIKWSISINKRLVDWVCNCN